MPLPTVTIFGTINKIETRFAQSGTQITSFQIECSEKNKDGQWENLYIRSAVFGKSAEFVNNHFTDGSLCVATGKLVTEVYDGKDGKRYDIKLKFPTIEFPPKAKSNDAPQSAPKRQEMPQSNMPEIEIDIDEVPF